MKNIKKTAIILVTDNGFLVPTLVVCRQLAAQSVTDIADIVVYLVDVQDSVRIQLEAAFTATDGIIFEPLTSKAFLPTDAMHFYENHVPPVSLARLILNETIPQHYENILYLDGDLQIVGDISPLIRYVVPEGKIAAARGSLWLEKIIEGHPTPWFVDYLNGLGGVEASEYFNSGVLAFRRETWSELAPKALKFFFENSMQCIRHDQSALNAVSKGRTVELAPAYNFHGPYADLYIQCSYDPKIIHFTGSNKPWKYTGLPWATQFMSSYMELLDQHPFLNPFLVIPSILSPSQHALLYAKDAWKVLRYPRTLMSKRTKFFKHIKTGKFAF